MFTWNRALRRLYIAVLRKQASVASGFNAIQ
nr:MAG TPA: hypothetical protein [Caudoviricetes sp.]